MPVSPKSVQTLMLIAPKKSFKSFLLSYARCENQLSGIFSGKARRARKIKKVYNSSSCWQAHQAEFCYELAYKMSFSSVRRNYLTKFGSHSA